jgi:hypothetical protein
MRILGAMAERVHRLKLRTPRTTVETGVRAEILLNSPFKSTDTAIVGLQINAETVNEVRDEG